MNIFYDVRCFLKSVNKIISFIVNTKAFIFVCILKGVIFFISFMPSTAAQTVAINEFMSSNQTTIADEDGDFEDWIELYNYGHEAVNLKGFYLSDDYSNPNLWEFPDVTLPSGGYLLIWASGKNRRTVGEPLHTNFSIKREGEEIILTSPQGQRLDEVAPTALHKDWSLGRLPDGTGAWLYTTEPTPGSMNAPQLDGESLLHFWVFDDDMPNNMPLVQVRPVFNLTADAFITFRSSLEGYPFHQNHPLWRKASMERRNQPTAMNYRPQANDNIGFSDANIRGLQVKQPFRNNGKENKLILHLPTTGFKNIVLKFAAKDENAADYMTVDYAVSMSDNWTVSGLSETTLPLEDFYKLYEIDFSNIEEVNNNPFFKVRIRFHGNDMYADDDNRVVFNNFSTDALPLKAHYITSSSGENGIVHPFGFHRVFEGYNLNYSFFPTWYYEIDDVTVDGNSVKSELEMGLQNAATYSFKEVNASHHIHATFKLDAKFLDDKEGQLLLYPNPTNGPITIVSQNTISKITLSEIGGREFLLKNDAQAKEITLDLSRFGAGLYFLSLKNEQNSKTVIKKIQLIK